MRILILGGDGMLGHQLLKSYTPGHEVRATLRRDLRDYRSYGLFSETNSYCGIDVRSSDRLLEVLADFRPEAVINAIGIIKQRSESKASVPSLEVNALLPHRLSAMCQALGARLVQLGTDCVFSGYRGMYREEDLPDANDLYGRSKYLGELYDAHCVTLRTSIIGLELARKRSLVEWFLGRTGAIEGYRRAIFSGFTTQEMGRIIERVLLKYPDLSGLWHVAAEPISKYDLLNRLGGKLGRKDVHIDPEEEFQCDRSLDGSRFERETGYHPPSWDTMLDELAEQIKQRGNLIV